MKKKITVSLAILALAATTLSGCTNSEQFIGDWKIIEEAEDQKIEGGEGVTFTVPGSKPPHQIELKEDGTGFVLKSDISTPIDWKALNDNEVQIANEHGFYDETCTLKDETTLVCNEVEYAR